VVVLGIAVCDLVEVTVTRTEMVDGEPCAVVVTTPTVFVRVIVSGDPRTV
jgi:hypothetical protein